MVGNIRLEAGTKKLVNHHNWPVFPIVVAFPRRDVAMKSGLVREGRLAGVLPEQAKASPGHLSIHCTHLPVFVIIISVPSL